MDATPIKACQVFTHTICLSKIKGMSFRITDEVQIYYLTTVIRLATWKFSCCNKSKFFHPVSVIYRMMTLNDWQGEIKSIAASINFFCSMPKNNGVWSLSSKVFLCSIKVHMVVPTLGVFVCFLPPSHDMY